MSPGRVASRAMPLRPGRRSHQAPDLPDGRLGPGTGLRVPARRRRRQHRPAEFPVGGGATHAQGRRHAGLADRLRRRGGDVRGRAAEHPDDCRDRRGDRANAGHLRPAMDLRRHRRHPQLRPRPAGLGDRRSRSRSTARSSSASSRRRGTGAAGGRHAVAARGLAAYPARTGRSIATSACRLAMWSTATDVDAATVIVMPWSGSSSAGATR